MNNLINEKLYKDAVFIIQCFDAYVDMVIETSRIDFIRKYYNTKNKELVTDFEDTALNSNISYDDTYFENELADYEHIENIFTDENVYKKAKDLSLRHKQILYYLFVEQRTATETADIMNLSAGRITQLKDEALKIIRG